MQARKQISRLTTQNCVFLECDLQEKMRGLIKNFDTVSHNAQRLGKMANLFQIPIIATAQAPKVFGPTIKELSDLYTQFGDGAKHFTKNTFSMMEPQIYEHLQSLQRKKIVLYGVEAHICVKQTALDLLERDFEVCLVIDAVSSMSYHDRTAGIDIRILILLLYQIEALRDAGATITTFQSLAFELARSPECQGYKDLLKLIKDMPKEHLHLHHHEQAKL